MKFVFKNREFEYFIHHYNDTQRTERAVEIPLLKMYKDKIDQFIEIGCVSPYYFPVTHTVYDLTDKHPACTNLDADKIDLDNKNILSISTIEHFGAGDYGNQKETNKASKFLEKILNLECTYLVSWPLGYNLELDEFVFLNVKTAAYISRDNNDLLTWKQKTFNELDETDKKYGTFYCANTICILENFL
jgi:hypothetical protein